MAREGGCARSCSILAAGGKRGMVKLIHPRANLAYGEFRASRRAIAVLHFSPQQTSFLFSECIKIKRSSSECSDFFGTGDGLL